MKIYYVATAVGDDLVNIKAFSSKLERREYLKNTPMKLRKDLVIFEGDAE